MTATVRRIPFRLLGTTSDVHLRHLEEDPDLWPFLGRRAHDVGELLAAAPVHARRLLAPSALSRAAVAYAERHDAPAAVLDNAAALADGATCAVVTGQQPGLFGGPLYSFHKIATTIRLARELGSQPGAPRVVPVFWNHTDDHDLEEANRAFFVNQGLDLQRVRLDLPRTGAALCHIPVARPMEQALAALRDLLPLTEFREWAFEPLVPVDGNDTLGDLMARLLLRTFGDEGLVVIEPRDLPDEAFEVLPRWCESAEDIRDVIRSSIEHLGDAGIDATLDPTATLMFQDLGQRRMPMADGETAPRPASLSPGVLLRPLWQDACLPTIASVVGPGELAYLSVAGPLYRHLGVPAPVFVPRASLTLVEPSLQKLLKRFQWDLPDLAAGPTALAESIGSEEGNTAEAALEELGQSVRRQMADIASEVSKLDPSMATPIERSSGKIAEDLAKLAGKVRRERQNREGTGVRQIRRLCSHLRPRGRQQERVLTAIPFLVAHGPELADILIDAADPFELDHGVVEL